LVVCATLASVAGQSPDPVIVTVNKEPVTRAEFDKKLATTSPPWTADAERRRIADERKAQMIVDAVDEVLLVQRGRELGYGMSDAEFEQTAAKIRKDNHISTDEQFQAALAAEHMTLQTSVGRWSGTR
jgi:hypothetical protein